MKNRIRLILKKLNVISKIRYWLARNKTIIISGADTTHFKSLLQLLTNLKDIFGHNSGLKIVIWDLGLTEEQLKELQSNFNRLCVFYKFEFKNYPDWVNIRINAGEYAWKPILIAETMKMEGKGKQYLVWLDSGNLVSSKDLFRVLLRNLQKSLIYSSITSGLVTDWTHPKMLEYMNVKKWGFDLLGFKNRNGALLGFNIQKKEVVELINDFSQLALIKDCIAPQDSSRQNHRQDQALFTLLYYKFHFKKHHLDLNKMTESDFGISAHNDID